MDTITELQRLRSQKTELIDALRNATALLMLEFSDTEGSGQEIIQQCQRILGQTEDVPRIPFIRRNLFNDIPEL